MPRIIISLIMLSLLVLPAVTSAQVATANFDLENATFGLGQVDLKTAIQSIVQILLGFLGIIAVLIILYGGFLWMTAMGDDSQIAKAKKLIIASIVGIVIILAAYAIASFVIESIQEVTE